MSSLYYRCVTVEKSLNLFLKDFLADPPELTWLEPRPRPAEEGPLGPIQGFQALQRGISLVAHPLDEARLFWPDRAVHAVATADGQSRYFAYGDVSVEGWSRTEVRVERGETILVRRDWNRFNAVPSDMRSVKVIRYYCDDRLVAWRLRIGESG